MYVTDSQYGMEKQVFYLFYFILLLINLVQVTDNAGRTCLHVAAASGHYDMVQVLIGQGADLNVADKVKIRL
jgi:ankyrin repeat protein